MNDLTIIVSVFLAVAILTYVSIGIKIIKQYKRGVLFTLGKYSGILNPGFNFIFPFFQSVDEVDIRQGTLDLDAQEVMTKDQINLTIDGVIFYRVINPENVILNVKDIFAQLKNKATSELKEIIGNMTMKESLSSRDVIAQKLIKELDKAIRDEGEGINWGVSVKAVQINNIQLPESLIRAMAKQAEAEREKEARIIKALGEFEAAKKFKEASVLYNNNPSMIRLRELQTYQEIGAEKNSLIIVVPETILGALKR